MIKESSAELGVDLYDLFVEIVAEKDYNEVMNEDNKNNMKSRLEPSNSKEEKERRYKLGTEKYEDVNEMMKGMDQELIILFKTNDYLRSIDKRLGNPTNTFNVINEVTWRVYRKEVCSTLSRGEYWREVARFYLIKFGLYLAYLYVKIRSTLGLQVDEEELLELA